MSIKYIDNNQQRVSRWIGITSSGSIVSLNARDLFNVVCEFGYIPKIFGDKRRYREYEDVEMHM